MTTNSYIPRHTSVSRPVGLGPARRLVREIGLTLITLGVIILLFVVYQLLGTNFTEADNQAALKKSFDAQLVKTAPPGGTQAPVTTPSTTAPSPASGGDSSTVGGGADAVSAPSGSAIEHMVIPKIGVDKFVVEGTSEADLTRGPGHYAGTPYPGQVGNVGIAGHRTTYGAPFYRLDQLGIGDYILFTNTSGQTFKYQVDQPALVVSPNDVAVLNPTTDAELTLTTCNPRFSATSRLIVKAKLVSTLVAVTPPVTTPVRSTATASTPPAKAKANLTGGNHSAWPPAITYGLIMVVLWIGTRVAINRTRRLARVGSYVGGIAVCSVPLWLCFENVVRLLPQSI